MSEPSLGELFKAPRNIIVDAKNELIAFRLHFVHQGIEKVKELIKTHGVRTLEEFTGQSTAELEAMQPGITSRYNNLVMRLRDPNLSEEELQKVMQESYKLTEEDKEA